MLDRKPARPRSLASFHDMPVEDELAITRTIAERLWRLLERRHPHIAAELIDDADEDLIAAADRALEAALVLQSRDRIRVEPCRQLLDCQRFSPLGEAARYYVITRIAAEPEVVDEAKLLMLAGIDTDPDAIATEHEVPL